MTAHGSCCAMALPKSPDEWRWLNELRRTGAATTCRDGADPGDALWCESRRLRPLMLRWDHASGRFGAIPQPVGAAS